MTIIDIYKLHIIFILYMNKHSTQISNVLVIGSGGAGLRAAIEAKQEGMDVTVLGKRQRTDVHTVLAAGGINAAFGNVDQEDSWEQHFADTYIEGYGLSEPEVVELMAKESPQVVEEIDNWGANFAKLDIRGTNIANSNHYILSYGAGHANNQEFHMVNTLGDLVFRTGTGSDTDRLRIDTDGRISNNSREATDYGSPNLLISGNNSMFTMMGDGSINNSSYTGIKFRVAGASTGDYTKAGIFVVRQGSYNDLDMLFCFNKDANATGVSDGDERLRINSDGQIGIGTDTVDSSADVSITNASSSAREASIFAVG